MRVSISITSSGLTLSSRATASTCSGVKVQACLWLRRLKNSLRWALVVATLTMRQFFRHVLVDLGLDPVHRIRHQAHALFGVEALDGLHQADVAFLDQVGVRQAIAQYWRASTPPGAGATSPCDGRHRQIRCRAGRGPA
jgi:hypothetical protein